MLKMFCTALFSSVGYYNIASRSRKAGFEFDLPLLKHCILRTLYTQLWQVYLVLFLGRHTLMFNVVIT